MASRDKRPHRTVPVWTFCRLRCDMKHHRQWALTKHYRQWRLNGISEGTRALEAVRMFRSQYFHTPLLTRS